MAVEQITETEWEALRTAIELHQERLAKLLHLEELNVTPQYDALTSAAQKLEDFFGGLFAKLDEPEVQDLVSRIEVAS